MAADVSTPHLLRLPLELRRHIFAFVFTPEDVTNKKERLVSHTLSLSILRVNRQISVEAREVMLEECLFVHVVSDLPYRELKLSRLQHDYKTLHCGPIAARFRNTVLLLRLHAKRFDPYCRGARHMLLLFGEDFRKCCQVLRHRAQTSIRLSVFLCDPYGVTRARRGRWTHCKPEIEDSAPRPGPLKGRVDSDDTFDHIVDGLNTRLARSGPSASSEFLHPVRQRKLLGPVMQYFHDIQRLHLKGVTDEGLRNECRATVRCPRWTDFEDMIIGVVALKSLGIKHLANGRLESALEDLQDALFGLGLWRAGWTSEPLPSITGYGASGLGIVRLSLLRCTILTNLIEAKMKQASEIRNDRHRYVQHLRLADEYAADALALWFDIHYNLPDDFLALGGLVHLAKSRVLKMLGDRQGARHILATAMSLDPDSRAIMEEDSVLRRLCRGERKRLGK